MTASWSGRSHKPWGLTSKLPQKDGLLILQKWQVVCRTAPPDGTLHIHDLRNTWKVFWAGYDAHLAVCFTTFLRIDVFNETCQFEFIQHVYLFDLLVYFHQRVFPPLVKFVSSGCWRLTAVLFRAFREAASQELWFIIIWLVVLTILKNISQWEWLSHILWKIENVWNHQPVMMSCSLSVSDAAGAPPSWTHCRRTSPPDERRSLWDMYLGFIWGVYIYIYICMGYIYIIYIYVYMGYLSIYLSIYLSSYLSIYLAS